MEEFVSFKDGGAFSIWYCSDVDSIAVIVVKQKDVVVASAGQDNEAAHEVGECLARLGVPDCCVALFRANTVREGEGLEVLLDFWW